MATTAGALSANSVSSNSASLSSAAATGGTAPYTYQWYRSTTTGFTPGGGNIIAGATALNLADNGLIPVTGYFYKVVATDAGAVAGTSSQLPITTTPTSLSQNTFAQPLVVGMVDLRYAINTVSCQIDDSVGTGLLYAGQAVKLVPSTARGVPKVTACTANADSVFGFINYDVKSVSFGKNKMCEVSLKGNAIYLYTTAAITQGNRVCLDVSATAGVQPTGASANVVGYAYDGASAAGQLIRVMLDTPSFATA